VFINIFLIFCFVNEIFVSGGDGYVFSSEVGVGSKGVEDGFEVFFHVYSVGLGHGGGEGVFV